MYVQLLGLAEREWVGVSEVRVVLAVGLQVRVRDGEAVEVKEKVVPVAKVGLGVTVVDHDTVRLTVGVVVGTRVTEAVVLRLALRE